MTIRVNINANNSLLRLIELDQLNHLLISQEYSCNVYILDAREKQYCTNVIRSLCNDVKLVHNQSNKNSLSSIDRGYQCDLKKPITVKVEC